MQTFINVLQINTFIWGEIFGVMEMTISHISTQLINHFHTNA